MTNPTSNDSSESDDLSTPTPDAMRITHIENLLHGLVPASASPELFSRVKHDFALAAKFRDATIPALQGITGQRKPLFQPLTWATFGAAAAVVIMSTMQYAHYHPRNTGSNVIVDTHNATPHLTTEIPEVTSSREFLKVNDGGINFSQAGQAERRLTVKSIERKQWVDPSDGAVYIIEIPHEHAVVVPVNIQ